MLQHNNFKRNDFIERVKSFMEKVFKFLAVGVKRKREMKKTWGVLVVGRIDKRRYQRKRERESVIAQL